MRLIDADSLKAKIMGEPPEARYPSWYAEQIKALPSAQLERKKGVNRMSDLISRQAAIDAANRTDYTGLAVEDVKKVTDEVVKELKQLPSAQPEQRWIPVTERLPEESERYLISAFDGVWKRTTIAQYQPRYKAWTMTGRMAYWKVVAWMPLPEPYRAEGKDD